ncbi:hypothetical protein GUJ93_ZPchr0010g8768 [Zizania palustris]|uniref:Uncharacterized protein n=1 Tax=Zizania palustris TaxID=103762 RepID=A0A8J5WC61_ZIZPA|nr:hypothetical protein GUJ93_ZPchr0010g8768 [Zizania palustris]
MVARGDDVQRGYHDEEGGAPCWRRGGAGAALSSGRHRVTTASGQRHVAFRGSEAGAHVWLVHACVKLGERVRRWRGNATAGELGAKELQARAGSGGVSQHTGHSAAGAFVAITVYCSSSSLSHRQASACESDPRRANGIPCANKLEELLGVSMDAHTPHDEPAVYLPQSRVKLY